jgi:RHS repeat-associated protein
VTGQHACDAAAAKFTGKERDAESGMDYFGARYYASLAGRFQSADLPVMDQHPANPQTWNLYAYARNNPLLFVDPDGRTYCQVQTDDEGNETFVNCISDEEYQKDPAKYDEAGYVHVITDVTVTVEPEPETGPEPAWWDLPGQFFVSFGDCVLNESAGGCGRLVWNVGSGGLTALPLVRSGGAAILTFASGLRLAQVADIVSRASSAIGNQSIYGVEQAVAVEAAKTFLGSGAQPLRQEFGSRAGQITGQKSAGRIVRCDLQGSRPHLNFQNLHTGGNLHVYVK